VAYVSRLEWSFRQGDVEAHEGLWLVPGAGLQLADYADLFTDLLASWFTTVVPDGGKSRQDLMPDVAIFHKNRLLEFASEFLQIENDLVSAAFGLTGTNNADPLPMNVSKEVEFRGVLRGRSAFSRVHTSCWASDAVDPDNPSHMRADYVEQLRVQYLLLVQLLNTVVVRVGIPPHTHLTQLCHVVYLHKVTPLNAPVFYLYQDVETVRVKSPRWGTMRRRGSVIHH
jgi:hypothetical protein